MLHGKYVSEKAQCDETYKREHIKKIASVESCSLNGLLILGSGVNQNYPTVRTDTFRHIEQ